MLHQQGLDTTTPAGKAMFQMMGVFAEFERAMIQERVRAGLARARDEGTKLGRPKIAKTTEKAIRAAHHRRYHPGLGGFPPALTRIPETCPAGRRRGFFGVPSMIDSLEVKVLHPA